MKTVVSTVMILQLSHHQDTPHDTTDVHPLTYRTMLRLWTVVRTDNPLQVLEMWTLVTERK